MTSSRADLMVRPSHSAERSHQRPGTEASRLVAIASGKGGVGKTWLATTLAQSLSEHGRRVLLVDMDLGLANVDIQLGLTPRHDLASFLAGGRSLSDAITRHACLGHEDAAFDVLPGRSGAASMASLDIGAIDRLIRALRDLDGYELVLLDLGAGIDPAMRFAAAMADTLLVMCTDEPTAVADAYAVLKLQARDRAARGDADRGADVRLVVNQCASQASGQRTYEILSRACTTFLGQAPPLAGTVRRDSRVPDAIRRQIPLLIRHPNACAADDVRRLAMGLGR